MGFENDFHRILEDLGISRAELAERVGASPAYVSKVLNGTAGNFQLTTMAKWARAVGAVLQIRLIREGQEVVRVVDYETAGALDDAQGEDLHPVPAQESRKAAG
jgi:transcriptional regulator with XRE-family HTH domain